MADKNKQQKKGAGIQNLPNKPVTKNKEEQVKGGRMGGDDDLDDLEVER